MYIVGKKRKLKAKLEHNITLALEESFWKDIM